jgi:hypothetical protein
VDDERVEVVGETLRRGGVARPIELVDQRLQSLLPSRSSVASSSACQ